MIHIYVSGTSDNFVYGMLHPFQVCVSLHNSFVKIWSYLWDINFWRELKYISSIKLSTVIFKSTMSLSNKTHDPSHQFIGVHAWNTLCQINKSQISCVGGNGGEKADNCISTIKFFKSEKKIPNLCGQIESVIWIKGLLESYC